MPGPSKASEEMRRPVGQFIKAGHNIDYYDHISGHTALSIAPFAGHLKVVVELVEAGALISNSLPMVNALTAACQKRHRPII